MKRKKKIVVYPYMDTSTVAQNPYINDFCQNLENLEFDILNKNIRGNPLFPLIRYIFDADIFIFHWIENVPVYKKGFLQFIYAIVLLVILKLLGKKIVWFCHNKKVHGLKNKIQETESNHLLYLIKKKSTHIFTHSKEGLEILNKYNHKSIYLMHPTKNRLTNYEFSKKYDLLIWGSISKYKGILEFLSEVKSNPKLQSLKIKIIGNCEDRVLLDKINNSLSTNISFENRSISFEELNTLRASIEFVLITYKTETVLSSAILMDSLSFGFSIIAPDTAVFRELKNENRVNVKTYKNFSSVPDLIEESKEIVNYENFLSEYSWPDFTKNMSNTLFKN